MLKRVLFHLLKVKTYKIKEIRHEYNDVYSFILPKKRGDIFKAGNHTHLVMPGGRVTKPNVRHMSVASSPGERDLIFTMDLQSNSEYKKAFRWAEPGDRVKLFHFGGDFHLDKVQQGCHIHFIAGGLGVTPIRSMIKDIIDRDLNYTFDLTYAAKGYLFRDLFDSLKANVQYVKRETLKSRVESLDQKKSKYFICGSNSFVQGVMNILKDIGIDKTEIVVENFL